MIAMFLLGLTSFFWGGMGIIMTVVPQMWALFSIQMLENTWHRFWVTQAMIFSGLVLIVGTSQFQGVWVWVICGVMMVGKACLILGASQSFLARLTLLSQDFPKWVYRIGGVGMLVLAVLLATDLILNG